VALRQVQDALSRRRVTVNIPDDLPPIDVDDVLIDQVLTNLLSNAIKYSPDASEIRIDAGYTEDTLVLSIQDSGIGIQPLEADKLFDKFYRSPYAQHIPGTGLGLAICKGIITAHGGTIKARRGSPRGTVMTIELPLLHSIEKEPASW
jgi:two-component system sensor histidine kinase KdpD